ncbi:MAG: hypothetical protein Q8S39_02680, partial [Ignavibacteria bacterium]|nr:hypothetical protein [Ignavibacteria bacterium]
MKRFLLLISICFVTATLSNANTSRLSLVHQDVVQSNSTPTVINYSIEPFYDVESFRLIIVLEFKG